MTWSASPSAGWYPDPEQPANLRWWDGTQWTEYRTPAWQPPTGLGSYPGPATPDSDLTYLLPVNRDGFAIASGYLGLFSLIPNPFTSIAAIACGIVGLNRMKHTNRLGRGRAYFGIVAGALSLAVFAFLVLAGAGANSDGRPGTPTREDAPAIAHATLDAGARIVTPAPNETRPAQSGSLSATG